MSSDPLQDAVDSMEGPMREPSSESVALDDVEVVRGVVDWSRNGGGTPRVMHDAATAALNRLTDRLRRAEAERDENERLRAFAEQSSIENARLYAVSIDRIESLSTALREIADLDRKTHHLLPALSIARRALNHLEHPEEEGTP